MRFLLLLPLLLALGCTDDPAGDASAPDPVAQAPASCEDAELGIEEVEPGTGAEATVASTVRIAYQGRFSNGEVFDQNDDLTYPLNQFVPGFRDGIAGMKEGGKRRLTIPPNLGYGPEGAYNPDGSQAIPPCATLLFDVELLELTP